MHLSMVGLLAVVVISQFEVFLKIYKKGYFDLTDLKLVVLYLLLDEVDKVEG